MANYDFTYTGAEIQAILDTAKKLKDSGYIFLGVATPSTNPGTPTQKVYYEASQAGTYTNFGNIIVPEGLSFLLWNGTWSLQNVNIPAYSNRFSLLNYRCSVNFIPNQTIDLDYNIGEVVSNLYFNATDEWSHCRVDVSGVSQVLIKAHGGNRPRAYGFLDEDNILLAVADANASFDNYLLDVPSGAKTLIINDRSGGYCYCVINRKPINGWIYKKFSPSWIGGNPVNSALDSFGFGKSESSALNLIHSRIFRVLENTIIRISGFCAGKHCSVVFYNSNWNKVQNNVIHTEEDSSTDDVLLTVPNGSAYLILQGYYLIDGIYYRDMGITVSMFIREANPYSFAPRPSDNGYQHLTMCVGTNNKESNSYTPSNVLQVETEYHVDNGIICLPESYSEDGDATRLIVFTHGHAVVYNNGATRFDSDDIKPEYWLSEGYAIMDMDGSVTGTFSGNHDYEPAAINAYETAYQWVVRHYNIRTDGVFSTGRSMGGGMQFSLIRASAIPIIASAPMVPVLSPFGGITSSNTGAARKELLKAYGVPSSVLDAVTWTTAATPYYNLTQAEKDVIIEDQRVGAPYAPGYCINRPYTNAEIEAWSQAGISGEESYIRSFIDSIKDSINVSPYKNIPIRMYTCVGDLSVKYKIVIGFHEILSRAGYNVQIHVFPATADHSVIPDHRFEINPENLITYTNSKGVTLTDVPKVYIETLAFWRCYENQDGQV